VLERLRAVPGLLPLLTLAKMMTLSSMMKVTHALMVMMLIQNTAEPLILRTSSLLMLRLIKETIDRISFMQ
jgi:hypothetical protein